MPLVDYYCNWYITILPFVVLLMCLLNRFKSLSELIVPLIIVIILVFLRYMAAERHNDFLTIFMDGIVMLTPCYIGLFLKKCDNNKITDFFSQLIILFATITSITSISGYNMYPNASRELASGTAVYDTIKYSFLNIGGYDFIYALCLLIPFFVYIIKRNKGLIKALDIIALVICCWCIYLSQYTIALILLVFTFGFLLIMHNRRVGIPIVLFMFMFILFGGLGLFSNILYGLADLDQSGYVAHRLILLGDLLGGKLSADGTSNMRMNLYMQAINSFKQNPVFGVNLFNYNKYNISGHSLILDLLGSFGVVGLTIYVLLFKKLIAKTSTYKDLNFYGISILVLFVIFALLNTVDFLCIYLVLFSTLAIISINEGKKQDELHNNIGDM